VKKQFGVFCVTISDRASKGEYPEDLSGKALRECVASNERFVQVGQSVIVPDEIHAIQGAVKQGILLGADLVLTSGGTGFSPTDVTPEAVEPLISKQCHSLTQYMQAEAVRTVTPLACLSRSVIGMVQG
jgi:molybdenum cofactor synthesis domain-containing protein